MKTRDLVRRFAALIAIEEPSVYKAGENAYVERVKGLSVAIAPYTVDNRVSIPRRWSPPKGG